MVEQGIKDNPGLLDVIKSMSPLGRLAEPEEVAEVIVFLCGANASYVTGTGLVIDAGLTLSIHLT